MCEQFRMELFVRGHAEVQEREGNCKCSCGDLIDSLLSAGGWVKNRKWVKWRGSGRLQALLTVADAPSKAPRAQNQPQAGAPAAPPFLRHPQRDTPSWFQTCVRWACALFAAAWLYRVPPVVSAPRVDVLGWPQLVCYLRWGPAVLWDACGP